MNSVNISPKLKKLLNLFNINFILSPDIDYLDIDDKSGDYILYTPSKKVDYLKSKGVDLWDKKRKNRMRVGRFLKSIILLSDSEIEEASSKFRSEYNMMMGNFEEFFEEVRGIKIWWWYRRKKYKGYKEGGGGKLNRSCMKHAPFIPLLLYVMHPHVCRLLIMKTEDGKLKGRALLWKTNKGWYMDRVYTYNSRDEIMYQKYAKIKNILSYKGKSWDSPRINDYRKMRVRLLPIPFIPPYLDTFKYRYTKLIPK
jgi:hypothetical protein